MSSAEGSLSVTMIRCSTLLLRWGGMSLLTDPWFAMHLRGLPCFRRPGLSPQALPPLDGVLVSHLHPDHYDPRAMARTCCPPRRWLFPPGSHRALGGLPPGGEELAPWSSARIGRIEVLAVPGPHTGPKPDEVNYLIELPGWGSVFFGGDAKLDRDTLTRIRAERGPVRLALLPVGATRIFGVRTVMCPPHAAEARTCSRPARWSPSTKAASGCPCPPLPCTGVGRATWWRSCVNEGKPSACCCCGPGRARGSDQPSSPPPPQAPPMDRPKVGIQKLPGGWALLSA
jgi:L-ascorbate metabolism protein UlaG (beta-lactamase superfamily)